MLDTARAKAPELEWHLADLLDIDLARTFDLVALPGNVMIFLSPGPRLTSSPTWRHLATAADWSPVSSSATAVTGSPTSTTLPLRSDSNSNIDGRHGVVRRSSLMAPTMRFRCTVEPAVVTVADGSDGPSTTMRWRSTSPIGPARCSSI